MAGYLALCGFFALTTAGIVAAVHVADRIKELEKRIDNAELHGLVGNDSKE